MIRRNLHGLKVVLNPSSNCLISKQFQASSSKPDNVLETKGLKDNKSVDCLDASLDY